MINGLVKIGKAIYKHRAGIAVTVGVVTGVACVVETARKSVKNTPWILDEHEEKMEDLKVKYMRRDENDNEVLKEELTDAEVKEFKKAKIKVYKETGWALTKNYAVALGLGAVSITSTLYSYKVIKGQYVAVSTAYAALSDKFGKYRNNIVEAYGETADFNAMNDIQTVTETDKKGNVTKTTYLSKREGTDVKITLDNSYWGCFDMTNAGNTIINFKAMMAEQQHRLESGAIQGITLASIADQLGCYIPFDNMPLDWKILGYAANEIIDFDIAYDTNKANWERLPYSDSLMVPPIEITFKNVSPVLSVINPGNDEYAILENTYKNMVNDVDNAETFVETPVEIA